MYLLKNNIITDETITQIKLEKIADDFLMISVDYDTDDHSRVFSYWRLLGNCENPPLEIGINTDRKTIKSINFFVDIGCFKAENYELLDMLSGNITVDTDVFKKKNDYVDTEGEFFITVSSNKLICVFGLHNRIKEAIGNDRIKFLINNDNELCGFEIYNLSENDIKDIKAMR